MIYNKSSFIIGIFCVLCFVVNVANGRDLFTLGFTAFAAITNLICAFIEM